MTLLLSGNRKNQYIVMAQKSRRTDFGVGSWIASWPVVVHIKKVGYMTTRKKGPPTHDIVSKMYDAHQAYLGS